eukprot:COSAG01_NODE_38095_length_493_cov_1.113924_1_plen_130_part_01
MPIVATWTGAPATPQGSCPADPPRAEDVSVVAYVAAVVIAAIAVTDVAPTVAVAVVLVPRNLVAVCGPRYQHRHHPASSLPHSRVGSSMGRHDGENPELTTAAIRALCVVLRTCINIYFRHTTGAYLFIT